jgi:hypothetical protein
MDSETSIKSVYQDTIFCKGEDFQMQSTLSTPALSNLSSSSNLHGRRIRRGLHGTNSLKRQHAQNGLDKNFGKHDAQPDRKSV